jgi:hypothetical protein
MKDPEQYYPMWHTHSISDLIKRSDDLINNNFDRKAINIARRNELLKLAVELNTLKWIGSDAGWDLAVSAVSKRILELTSEIHLDD